MIILINKEFSKKKKANKKNNKLSVMDQDYIDEVIREYEANANAAQASTTLGGGGLGALAGAGLGALAGGKKYRGPGAIAGAIVGAGGGGYLGYKAGKKAKARIIEKGEDQVDHYKSMDKDDRREYREIIRRRREEAERRRLEELKMAERAREMKAIEDAIHGLKKSDKKDYDNI